MHYYHTEGWQSEQMGNNAISYAERMALGSHGKLFLPQLVDGTLNDLTLGENIVFEELEDGELVSCKGLKKLLQIVQDNKTIYITDNHNHALYFWYKALKEGVISHGITLLHVDQHADMNEPNERIDTEKQSDLDYIAAYVNSQTQIASFIQPAIKSGLLKECVQIRTESKLEEIVQNMEAHKPYILDIDIDFFAHEHEVGHKIMLLQRLIKDASLVTIATSPYFIDQNEAISLINKLLIEV